MNRFTAFILLQLFLFTESALACDLCAIYNSLQAQNPSRQSWHLGVANQYTSFDDLRDNGRKIDDPHKQRMDSYISQVFAAYDWTDSFSTQINLPFIYRDYKRFRNGGIEYGSEDGLGDLTLQARLVPFRIQEHDLTFISQVFIGLKAPTGDSDRLNEDNAASAGDNHDGLKHAGHDHGAGDKDVNHIHGHDIALGSGSWDVPLGLNLLFRYNRIAALSQVQYTLRSEGDFEYEYGDDLLFNFSPGYYAWLQHENAALLLLSFSGEKKHYDKVGGALQGDTALYALYLGPRMSVTLDDSFSLDAGIDFPVLTHNSETQSTLSKRIKFGLSWRF